MVVREQLLGSLDFYKKNDLQHHPHASQAKSAIKAHRSALRAVQPRIRRSDLAGLGQRFGEHLVVRSASEDSGGADSSSGHFASGSEAAALGASGSGGASGSSATLGNSTGSGSRGARGEEVDRGYGRSSGTAGHRKGSGAAAAKPPMGAKAGDGVSGAARKERVAPAAAEAGAAAADAGAGGTAKPAAGPACVPPWRRCGAKPAAGSRDWPEVEICLPRSKQQHCANGTSAGTGSGSSGGAAGDDSAGDAECGKGESPRAPIFRAAAAPTTASDGLLQGPSCRRPPSVQAAPQPQQLATAASRPSAAHGPAPAICNRVLRRAASAGSPRRAATAAAAPAGRASPRGSSGVAPRLPPEGPPHSSPARAAAEALAAKSEALRAWLEVQLGADRLGLACQYLLEVQQAQSGAQSGPSRAQPRGVDPRGAAGADARPRALLCDLLGREQLHLVRSVAKLLALEEAASGAAATSGAEPAPC